jgi:heme/copper-type cytochrome/quinol oxidase subunit 3
MYTSEAFLKHEPAAATDMVIYSLLGAVFLPVPMIEWSEANPAAISHQGQYSVLYINAFFLATSSIPFATCTHCIQRLPS